MKRKSPTKKAALTPYPSVHPSVLQTAGPLARVKQHLGGSRLLVDLIYDQSEHKVRIPGKMMGGRQGIFLNQKDLIKKAESNDPEAIKDVITSILKNDGNTIADVMTSFIKNISGGNPRSK